MNVQNIVELIWAVKMEELVSTPQELTGIYKSYDLWITPSLPLLPGPLRPGVVELIRVPSIS